MDEIDPPDEERLAKVDALRRTLREMPESERHREDLLAPVAAEYGRELLAMSHAPPPVPPKAGFGTRDARGVVGKLLEPRGQRAYARHHGHTTLGPVALRTGNTPAALEHLRASAAVDTDRDCRSYGPSFELARELCQRGFHAEVLAYLTACQSSWDEPALHEWRSELSEGRIPTFE